MNSKEFTIINIVMFTTLLLLESFSGEDALAHSKNDCAGNATCLKNVTVKPNSNKITTKSYTSVTATKATPKFSSTTKKVSYDKEIFSYNNGRSNDAHLSYVSLDDYKNSNGGNNANVSVNSTSILFDSNYDKTGQGFKYAYDASSIFTSDISDYNKASSTSNDAKNVSSKDTINKGVIVSADNKTSNTRNTVSISSSNQSSEVKNITNVSFINNTSDASVSVSYNSSNEDKGWNNDATNENKTNISNSSTVNYFPVYNETTNDNVNSTNKTSNAMENSTVSNITRPTSSVLSKIYFPWHVRRNSNENSKLYFYPEDECFCNRVKGICEINCCCDEDCSSVNRDIFETCAVQKPKDVITYCRNKVFNSPLFCLEVDNTYGKHFYPGRKVLRDIKVFEKVVSRTYVFPNIKMKEEEEEENYEQFSLGTDYAVGSKVIAVESRKTLKYLRFPTTKLTKYCRSNKYVEYLRELKESCYQRITDNSCAIDSSLNAEYYFKNLTLLASPMFANSSNSVNCTNYCVNVTIYQCPEENEKNCRPISSNNEQLFPKLSRNKLYCENVLRYIHLEISHNGVEGIVNASVYFHISDTLLLRERESLLLQTFTVSYKWFNQTPVLELSGNHGYLVSYPLITAYNVVKSVRDNVTEYELDMSNDSGKWLTSFTTSTDYWCASQRQNILFRQNTLSNCYLRLPRINTSVDEYCDVVQKIIFDKIFGPHIDYNNLYVSIQGDPDINHSNKWAAAMVNLPATHLNGSCVRIISVIHIHIGISVTGDVGNEQHRIFGVLINGETTSIPKSGESVRISLTVNFRDISNPPSRVFAEPPIYDIRIPRDFFYPFLSGSYSPAASKIHITLVVIALFFSNII